MPPGDPIRRMSHFDQFDIGVLGLGAMGSATAWALARRGGRVVAFDQAHPPHALGSTHGHTRIIREANYEHPLYVPLVQRAYALWGELARASGETLLLETGGLMAGSEDGALVRGARESAERHAIPHELLDADAIARRFPAYRPRPDWVAVHERRAGMLFPERCVRAFMDVARAAGADLRPGERVHGWRRDGNGVAVRTDRGDYRVRALIVAAGPWLPGLSDSVGVPLPLVIERQLSHWFTPAGERDRYAATQCPVALWDTEGADLFATLPDVGDGVKCGTHHAGAATTPDMVDRVVSDDENAVAARLLEEVMPGAAGALRDARVCLYTNTPDHHFIIDWCDPGRVLLLSPCSGHGFKFASAIGEIAAELALDGRAWIDLAPFSLGRFR